MSDLTRYQQDVLKSVEHNHIWINAMSCISPTDEFKIQLADNVLRMLKSGGYLIESDFDNSPLASLHQKELVLRINKS